MPPEEWDKLSDRERDLLLVAETYGEMVRLQADAEERREDCTIFLRSGIYSDPEFINFTNDVMAASNAAAEDIFAWAEGHAPDPIREELRKKKAQQMMDSLAKAREVHHEGAARMQKDIAINALAGVRQGNPLSPKQWLENYVERNNLSSVADSSDMDASKQIRDQADREALKEKKHAI